VSDSNYFTNKVQKTEFHKRGGVWVRVKNELLSSDMFWNLF